ncbi:MAG: hypothetical protein AAGK05_07085 [Pseudomonadota bacterium]
MELILSKLFIQNELNDVGRFTRGKPLEKHLNAVQKKIDILNIQEEKKASILLQTLDDDVVLELRSFHDYVEDYEYLVNKLRQFYGEDNSAVGLCATLLDIKQKPGQSIRDFISEIRVTTMRLFPNKNVTEREQILLMTFIEGLRNYKHAIILRQHNPATLNDAYDLLKNEKDVEAPLVMKIDGEAQSQIAKLNRKLDIALKKIDDLEEKLSTFQNQRPRNVGNFRRSNNQRIICHLCRKPGHMKRDCKSGQACKICSRRNHATENCFFKNTKNKVIRNVDNDSVKSCSSSEIQENGELMNEIADDFLTQDIEFNDTYMVTRKLDVERKCTKEKSYPKEVHNWFNYVEGNGAQPRRRLTREEGIQSNRRYQPTLISESRGEKAANKPVIPALVEGKISKNIFIDSGCECNIIDFSFLKSVSKVNPDVKFLKSDGGNLSCANGSPIKVVGHTILKLKVGGKSMQLKFTVVESIFPNILIGLRSMKAEKISIVPAWDCVRIGSVTVPFVSRVKPDNLN